MKIVILPLAKLLQSKSYLFVSHTYTVSSIPHAATGSFSALITDYLSDSPKLDGLFQFSPNDAGMEEAIALRQQYPIDRVLLVNTLQRQYEGFELPDKVKENIGLLSLEKTFTVTTAHQPNLLTGHLYFIYKIIHAAKLAQHLKKNHPQQEFVPVFYIGSEDNDLAELGAFIYEGKKYRWPTSQTGAVGRMLTDDLQALLNELYPLIVPPGDYAERLKRIIQYAYERQPTIAAATRYVINALLGHLGIVVIDPDDVALKQSFIPVIKEEILRPKAYELVQQTSDWLNDHYKAQAFARPVNFFYLKDDLRERIEQTQQGWKALHTDIRWHTQEEMIQEIEKYPDRFSPNVILRGLFQESILPNVAFIGGGSEVAYWLQLKPVFDYYKVFYPAVILRQSVLVEDRFAVAAQKKLGLSDEELFLPTEQLIRHFIKKHSAHELQLVEERLQITRIFEQIKQKAFSVDVTLRASTEAALAKIKHQIEVLEKKMIRAEKKNMAIQLEQIYKLKDNLFPSSALQERYETFMPFYLLYGESFFEKLMERIFPYGERFLILKESLP